MNVLLQMLQEHAAKGDDLVLNIVTGDESWFYHFYPKTKQWSMEWHNAATPKKKKARTKPSAAKIVGTVFLYAEGCILVDFLPREETVIVVDYVLMLQELQRALCNRCPMKRHLILQHNNAYPHTAHLALGKMETFGWELLPHPPYRLDLAFLDYHLFGLLNDHMRDLHYKNNETVQQAMCAWF
jgi:hypothetical protein